MNEGLYDKIDQAFKAPTNLTNEGLVQTSINGLLIEDVSDLIHFLQLKLK